MSGLTMEQRRECLDYLLSIRLPNAAGQESRILDTIEPDWANRLVIYGAGRLGHRLLDGLRKHGVEPMAFVDRNPAQYNSCMAGLEVLPPEAASQRFGADVVIAVAVWHPDLQGGIRSITEYLREIGFRHIVPFSHVFWKYPDTLLPAYLCDLPSRILPQVDAVRRAYALFDEPESQLTFLRHLELRITGDFAALPAPSNETQYFSDYFARPLVDEYFVDCGAYDGDTLAGFAQWTHGTFHHAIAFEPDPENFAHLQRRIADHQALRGRTRAVRAAVGEGPGRLRFAASGMTSAAISTNGNIDIDCISLDDEIGAELPTFIKMDIEGAELDALAGAAKVISTARPLLTICSYHSQNHLWEVPLMVRKLNPDSKLFLRIHGSDGYDLVCYAIPSSRTPSRTLSDLT